METPDFNSLFSPALERIFSFLNPHDRTRASVVSRSWSEAFECPSLWSATTLSFSKGPLYRPCFNPESIVRRFGVYFRKLTILCRNERRLKENSAKRLLDQFFGMMIVHDVQLDGVRMPRLTVLVYPNSNQRVVVRDNVLNFFRRQSRLNEVDFSRGDTHTLPCLMILEALVPENVYHLKLQNFFQHPSEILSPVYYSRYLGAITRFHSLRSLWLNYRYLTDEVITTLAMRLEGQLELFGVLVEKCDLIAHIISDDSWISLKTDCPNMEVHLRMELRRMITTTVIANRYISPRMPIVSVELNMGFIWIGQDDRPILTFLQDNFAGTLRDLTLEANGMDDTDVRAGLIALVAQCPHLENLRIFVRFPTFLIGPFYEGLLNVLSQMDIGMISLKVLRTNFTKLNKEILATTQQLRTSYIPRFREFGVQLVLKMHDNRILRSRS